MAALAGTILVSSEAAGASLGMLSREELLLMEKPWMRPRLISGKLDIPILIATSMIFLTIILWFDVLRVTIEYSFLNTNKTRNLVLGYLVFAIVMTIILGSVLIIVMKFWLNK